MMSRYVPSLIAIGLVLAGCSGTRTEAPDEYVSNQQGRIREQYGTVHGEPKASLLYSRAATGTRRRRRRAGHRRQRLSSGAAALETIDFMPLIQADPFGGVIITDWYSPPETPDERFKLNVYILDRALRADARQGRGVPADQRRGGWTDATVDPAPRPASRTAS